MAAGIDVSLNLSGFVAGDDGWRAEIVDIEIVAGIGDVPRQAGDEGRSVEDRAPLGGEDLRVSIYAWRRPP